MNHLTRMYNQKSPPPESEKNPNRVAGGLRAQGVDSYKLLGEDGSEREIPSQKYVQALEAKIKIQDSRLNEIDKKLRSLTNALGQIRNIQQKP